MKRSTALVQAALALSLSVFAGTTPGQDTGSLARGREAAEDGRGAEARALLDPLTRGDDARSAGQAWFFLGELAEREVRFADALSAYESSVARDPGGRYAARATARIEFLRVRSEGGFAPLAALEQVRGSAARASDPAALADLARRARSFPPGPVRAEAMLLVGQAYAGRLERPREAAEVLSVLARDASAPREVRRLAVQLLAQVREHNGEYAQGLAEMRALGGNDEQVARFRQLVRREKLHTGSLAVVGLVLLAGTVSAARAWRVGRAGALLAALRRPLPLAHLGMLSLGGALLARTYEDHTSAPFLGLGAGTLLVYAAATAWSVSGSTRPWARAGRAIVCAAAMLGASFLAMHRYDPAMLEGIGL